MTSRPLYFELHIRPLFREIDYLHMKNLNLDLWSYDVVSTKHEGILGRLEAEVTDTLMPPGDSGGPWPQEWIDLFKRWVSEGMKKLDLGEGDYRVIKRGTPPTYKLEATGSAPGEDWAVWLDRLPGRTNPPEFILYAEPPKPFGGGSVDPFEIRENFDPAGATVVKVTDRNGTHDVPIP